MVQVESSFLGKEGDVETRGQEVSLAESIHYGKCRLTGEMEARNIFIFILFNLLGKKSKGSEIFLKYKDFIFWTKF